MRRYFVRVAPAALLGILLLFASCASQLQYYDFDGESLRVHVMIAPDARVDADYGVEIDPDNPVRTLVSIGTSVAMASQVEQAQRKMDAATRNLDIGQILESQLESYYERAFDMRIADSSRRTTYDLSIEVTEYGIEASGPGSDVDFVLRGQARMYDTASRERIWRDRFSSRIQISPTMFGLPAAAGNVFSAAMLADLTEEEIATGLQNVAYDAAWEVASEFERDFYRGR